MDAVQYVFFVYVYKPLTIHNEKYTLRTLYTGLTCEKHLVTAALTCLDVEM